MGSTIPTENTAWKRAPALCRCVCEGVYCLQQLSPLLEWVAELAAGERVILALPFNTLFITGIKIVPNGHSRQGKLNTRKDSIQFPIKFKRKANNFRDNRSWTGTHMNSTPQIILFSSKLILTAAISSESWNLHPPK